MVPALPAHAVLQVGRAECRRTCCEGSGAARGSCASSLLMGLRQMGHVVLLSTHLAQAASSQVSLFL